MTRQSPEASGHAGGPEPRTRDLLFIDSAYSVASVRERGHQAFFAARHYHFFRRVWAVHPLVGLLHGDRAGKIRVVHFGRGQSVLDGFEPAGRLPRWLQPANVLWAQFRLLAVMVRIARKPAVGAVFASDVFYNGLLGLIAARLSGKPLMVACYANQDEHYEATGTLCYPRLLRSRRIELAIQHLVLRNADLVEAPTRNMRHYLLKHHARADRIVEIPVVGYLPLEHYSDPALRTPADEVLAKRGLPTMRPLLLTISRLIPLKFADDAVRAMILAVSTRPGAIGVVAGEGPMRPELQAMIDEAGVADRVFLPGNLSQSELAALAPVAIMLSPLAGMALIEASLGGAAPIVYDRDWQPEFVKDGENGYVVPHRAFEKMADRAIALIDDRAKRDMIGARARAEALAFADRQKHAQRQQQAMHRLVHSRGAGA